MNVKFNVMNERINIIDKKLNELINNKLVKTQDELLYEAYQIIKNFYNNPNEPFTKYVEVTGLPNKNEYISFINQIINDIDIIKKSNINTSEDINSVYSKIETTKRNIDNSIALIEKKFENTKYKLNNKDVINLFTDSFINMDYIDKISCRTDMVNMNTNYGYISLPASDISRLNCEGVIKIEEGSNGFPGNTHQAVISDGIVKFVGEDGVHLNLNDIVDDNNTWFEYEAYKIDKDKLLETQNLGFKYNEGIAWTIDNDKLILNLSITFNETQPLNSLLMTPFISHDKDAIAPVIKNIYIVNDIGQKTSLLNKDLAFDKDKIFAFQKLKCKTLFIIIEQRIPYTTTIGHMYFKEISNRNALFYNSDDIKFSNRIDGPKPLISNLNIIYNDKYQMYMQPSQKIGEDINRESNIKNNLFLIPQTNEKVKGYIELLQAQRFMIGIKNISTFITKYEEYGVYISKKFISDSVIKKIKFDADDFVPPEFDTSKEYINYFISFDDGDTWVKIKKDSYIVNSKTPTENRSNTVNYIDTKHDVYGFKVKIEITKDSNLKDNEYYSPIISEYKIETF